MNNVLKSPMVCDAVICDRLIQLRLEMIAAMKLRSAPRSQTITCRPISTKSNLESVHPQEWKPETSSDAEPAMK